MAVVPTTLSAAVAAIFNNNRPVFLILTVVIILILTMISKQAATITGKTNKPTKPTKQREDISLHFRSDSKTKGKKSSELKLQILYLHGTHCYDCDC